MKKRILLIGLALLLVISCALSACDGGKLPDDPNVDGAPTEYTISLKLLSRPVADAMLLIKDGAGNIKKAVTTNYAGTVAFTLPARADYRVFAMDGTEVGYFFDEGGYALTPSTEITLTPSVIMDERPADLTYRKGSTVYEIALTTVDGKPFSLAEALKTKKAVIINFFFTNCGPCKAEMPYFEEAYQTYGEDVAFIAVIPGYPGENESKTEAFRDEFGLSFDVAYTSSDELADAFRISAYPTTAVIDRYGTVCLLETGTLPSAAPLLAVCEKMCAEPYTQVLYNSFHDVTE
jgi:thiol-disulfide isomerase/thioredoxin